MVFGISTACFFPDAYNEDAVSLLGSLGVKNIELFFSCIAEYQMPFVNELKLRAQDSGINICSIHAYSLAFEPQLFSLHARARQEALDVYQRVLEAGAALGAGIYVFHGPAHLRRSTALTLDYPSIAQMTDPLARTAKSFGIRLAWETVHYCWYQAPDFPKRLLPHLETDNLYFTLDLKQAAQAGYDPISFVPAAAERLANIHVCDFVRDESLGVLPRLPFDGVMDFGALRGALAGIGYDGAMILEVYAQNYTSHAELTESLGRVTAFFSA